MQVQERVGVLAGNGFAVLGICDRMGGDGGLGFVARAVKATAGAGMVGSSCVVRGLRARHYHCAFHVGTVDGMPSAGQAARWILRSIFSS